MVDDRLIRVVGEWLRFDDNGYTMMVNDNALGEWIMQINKLIRVISDG